MNQREIEPGYHYSWGYQCGLVGNWQKSRWIPRVKIGHVFFCFFLIKTWRLQKLLQTLPWIKWNSMTEISHSFIPQWWKTLISLFLSFSSFFIFWIIEQVKTFWTFWKRTDLKLNFGKQKSQSQKETVKYILVEFIEKK